VKAEFETFDHTADMGIRVRAASLPELVEPATRALYAAIGRIKPSGDASPETIEIEGKDAAIILRDYLAELLVLFERDGRMVTSVGVPRFDHRRLRAEVATATVDPKRSEYHREVKAITYHELSIRAIAGGLEATFIVDI